MAVISSDNASAQSTTSRGLGISGEVQKEETPVPVTATMDGRGNSGVNAQMCGFDRLLPRLPYPEIGNHLPEVGKMVVRALVCHRGKGLGYE